MGQERRREDKDGKKGKENDEKKREERMCEDIDSLESYFWVSMCVFMIYASKR